MKRDKLTGLIAAPFTPLNENHELAEKKISTYASFLKINKIKGAYICGTSGEGISFKDADRKIIIQEWQKQAIEDFRIIAQIGSASLQSSMELAQHAETLDVFAISTMAPIFFKPRNLSDLICYCKQVAAAAPNTPFYYYHIPGMTGVNFPMNQFLPLAKKEIPTFAGIKFTNEDIRDYSLTKDLDPSCELFWGIDDTITSALSVGCKGFIGSTFNYAPNKYQEVIDLFNAGKHEAAAKAQLELNKIVNVLINSPLPPIATQRILMEQAGMDCGAGDTSTLFSNYEELRLEVVNALKETTFYSIVSELC